ECFVGQPITRDILLCYSFFFLPFYFVPSLIHSNASQPNDLSRSTSSPMGLVLNLSSPCDVMHIFIPKDRNTIATSKSPTRCSRMNSTNEIHQPAFPSTYSM